MGPFVEAWLAVRGGTGRGKGRGASGASCRRCWPISNGPASATSPRWVDGDAPLYPRRLPVSGLVARRVDPDLPHAGRRGLTTGRRCDAVRRRRVRLMPHHGVQWPIWTECRPIDGTFPRLSRYGSMPTAFRVHGPIVLRRIRHDLCALPRPATPTRRSRRCGRSGIDLPAISLGLWQNFGGEDVFETGRAVLRRAFDRGVTHFDLANNYGPPYGSAEANFGRWMDLDFRPHRDELVISSKAGWDMWPGPYGQLRLAQISRGQLRRELETHGPRLCRHLLSPPAGPQDTARRDHGGARPSREIGQSPLRRRVVPIRPK